MDRAIKVLEDNVCSDVLIVTSQYVLAWYRSELHVCKELLVVTGGRKFTF